MSFAAQSAWTVLDTRFGRGEGLLHSAQPSIPNAETTRLLHYVAVCDVAELPLWRSGEHAAFIDTPLSAELNMACSTALPGIQRMLLQGGRISLTLCAGPLQAMLSEQLFQADEVHIALDSDPALADDLWDKWAIQLLARRCRRGTRLHCTVTGHQTSTPHVHAVYKSLAAQGFVWLDTSTTSNLASVRLAEYNPRWELRSTRMPEIHQPVTTGLGKRCAIVGAGLAGASVAQALALRGWQVTVLDAQAEPAQGASGLPAGLLVPHVSVDDSPRSRMSRAGVRLTLQHAQRLLQRGEDWDATGVMELTEQAQRRLAALPDLQTAGWLAEGQSAQALWHPHAAWIKPARLVTAWLAHSGIQWMGSCPIARLERHDGTWVLQAAGGTTLATADSVVVANATGALSLLQGLVADGAIDAELLRKLQLLQTLHGTVSHGAMPVNRAIQPNPFPPYPINGNGSLIANVPTREGPRWYTGATYESDAVAATDAQNHHSKNLQHLQSLLPDTAKLLAAQFAAHKVSAWTGSRCVSHDRLPLVGPAHIDGGNGLWMNIAMGSRGLSFASLCAEWLAARMGHEPLPVEARLLRSLDTHRPLRQPT